MQQDPLPKSNTADELRVNFFRPRHGFMRREVTIIWITLGIWAVLTFGFPLYLAGGAQAELTTRTVFGVPLHYWFSGQFLLIWFILVCIVFNLLIDALTESFRRRRSERG